MGLRVLQADAADFFKRARQEAKRYGADPWVFLRELVQNSRDAKATSIQFTASHNGPWEVLTCFDNGTGMSAEELEKFLLRLYASSKEKDAESVGFFGVGFWSILRFRPALIRIATYDGSSQHAFEILPREGVLREYTYPLKQRGTLVALYRKRKTQSEVDFQQKVRRRLRHYAGAVRPARTVASLDLLLNGQSIRKELSPPKLFCSHVQHKHFQGFVGYGDKPSIRLYKGGILLRQLSSLSEVIPSRPISPLLCVPGFFPVFSLNIDSLVVLMDRSKVVEDPILHEAVSFCEETLNHLAQKLVKNLAPLPLKERLRGYFTFKRTLAWGKVAVLLVALVFAGAVLQKKQADKLRPPAFLEHGLDGWDGPDVQAAGDPSTYWNFHYTGSPDRFFFRVWSLDQPDAWVGLKINQTLSSDAYETIPNPGSNVLHMTYSVTGEKTFVSLPIPTGHRLITGSLQGVPLAQLRKNVFGDPVVGVLGAGTVTYASAPGPSAFVPRTVKPPALPWPAVYQEAMVGIRALPREERPWATFRFLRERLVYSRRPATQPLWRDAQAWFTQATSSESGDCDVLNGLLVLMLQEVGIPSHLSIGVVGSNQQVHGDLHAWATYAADGWQTLDLTSDIMAEAGSSPVAEARSREGAAPQPEQPMPPRPSMVQVLKRQPWFGWALLFVGLVVLGFVVRMRRKPFLDKETAEALMSRLLGVYFRSDASNDPFSIRTRPILTCLDGRKVSFADLDRGRGSSWFLAHPDAALLPYLKETPLLLDDAAPTCQALEELFPGIIHLDDLACLIEPPPLPEPLARLESLIQEGLDPDFRLYLDRSFRSFEVQLALKRPLHGKHHFVLGTKSAMGLQLNRATSDFERLSILVEGLTFYMNDAEDFLIQQAQGVNL